MAHKTLIDGTAYEISGGRTLVDGTTYSIDKGKTLVDGTAHEISFAQPTGITVHFLRTVSGYEDYAYIEFFDELGTGVDVRINSAGAAIFGQDDNYAIPDGTFFELPAGTEIKCYARTDGMFVEAMITVNGVTESATSALNYTHVLPGRADIYFTVLKQFSMVCGRIQIEDE